MTDVGQKNPDRRIAPRPAGAVAVGGVGAAAVGGGRRSGAGSDPGIGGGADAVAGGAGAARAVMIAAAAVILMLTIVAPVGLGSGEAVDLGARVLGVRRPFAESAALAELAASAATLLPSGEVGVRAIAVGALAAALALGLWVAWARARGARVAPPTSTPRGWWALLAGAALLGVSRPFLALGTTSPAQAIDFALLLGLGAVLETLHRDPGRASAGLALGFLCGLGAGAGWPVRAVAWPCGLAVTLWTLRRGHRWPLLAPMLFVAGAGIVLGGVVSAADASSPPVTLAALARRMGSAPAAFDGTGARAALAALGDDVGILALMVAAVGAAAAAARAPLRTLVATGLAAAALAAALRGGAFPLGRALAVAVLSAGVASGVAALASRFGRAGGAVAAVLAVVVLVSPASNGIGAALSAPARTAPHRLGRRLDDVAGANRGAPPLGDESDREAARWWRYARALHGAP